MKKHIYINQTWDNTEPNIMADIKAAKEAVKKMTGYRLPSPEEKALIKRDSDLLIWAIQEYDRASLEQKNQWEIERIFN